NILRYHGHKEIWIKTMRELVTLYKIRIMAWVIVNNHYHLLAYFNSAKILPIFINKLHGRTSYQFNKIENSRGRKIWYSYWDSQIRGEKDFWTKFNYIHYNPVKHQLVKRPEDWQYSSYKIYLEKKSPVWIADCWESYPVIEYNFE
ncbi:MAG: transposase, partial [Chloroflexota bacterium]|nr:transposase [Chloroflexota bacterium]